MNRHILIAATTLIALVGASSAFAIEATQEFEQVDTLSVKPRVEMKLARAALQREAGRVPRGEASAEPQPASELTRAEVVAETREAMRLGAIGSNEAEIRVASPAQQEVIRQAAAQTAGLHVMTSGTAR